MARIRTIKPEFPHSETLGRVSRDARLLFANLFTVADDEGRARASSRLLASLLYPFDDDANGLIDGWLVELEKVGAIRLYQVADTKYLDIPKWLEHQKIDRPSKSRLPAYNGNDSRGLARAREASPPDLGPRTMDLGPRKHPSDDAKASSGEVSPEPDLKTRIFGPMLDWLKKQSGKSEAHCRSMLGRWCKNHGEARTIEAVTAAARNAPLDPIPYVERIIRDGKSKPTARQSVTDHAHGLASVLGVVGVDAGKPPPAEPDGRQIAGPDGGTNPSHAAGDGAAIRPKHDETDRIRGGVRSAVRRPEIGAGDLPRDVGGPAGRLAGAGDFTPEIRLDVGQSDAVSGGTSGDGGGRPSGEAVVAGQGADCGKKTARGTQEQRDISGSVGGTTAANTEISADQTDGRSLKIGWAA